MSFPEYLRERISEDYKNLIIQKLEEIKRQTEDLGGRMGPSVEEAHQALRDSIRQEIDRMSLAIDSQIAEAQSKISEQIGNVVTESMSAWYHSDVSPYQQQLDMLISDIVSNVPPPPPKQESPDVVSLVDAIRRMDEAATQSEILNIVLQQISGWVNRSVLFVVKGTQASGWQAFGLGAEWDANKIRAIKVNLAENHILREVVNLGTPISGPSDLFPDNSQVFFQIGDTFPQYVIAAPILVRGKIAGVLYADMSDDISEKPDLPNLVYLAAHAAGSAIDLLALKAKPAVPGPGPSVVARPAAPAPAAPPRPQVVTAKAPAPAPPPPAPAPAPVAQAAAAVPAAAAEEEPELGTVMMQPAPRTAAAPVVSEEDQKLHEDAKRFARLLVSEIKLYNEAQVSAGREHRDIYERLHDDIERSRRMYQERIPQQIQGTTDYFYEELVKTLANGDPSLLGM